jgi:hypothetical protein
VATAVSMEKGNEILNLEIKMVSDKNYKNKNTSKREKTM